MSSHADTLWFSRISFAVAGLALLSTLHSGCQDDGMSAEPTPAAVKLEPGIGKTTEAEGSESEPGAGSHPGPERNAAPTSSTREPTTKDPTAEDKPSGVKSPADVEQAPETAPLAPLQLKRLVITDLIEEREPAEAQLTVGSEKPVIAFIELASGEGEAQQITVRFEHETGKQVGFVKLDVPAEKRRWRTWGQTRHIQEPGAWTAVVTDQAGKVLGQQPFHIDPA